MAASIMLNLPPITGSLISREKFPTFPPSITLSRSLNCPISSSFSSSYKCASIIISSRSSGKLSIPNAVQEEGTLTTHSPTAESSSSDELQQNPIGSTKKSVLVVGGTGGVVVATLLNRNVKTRLLLRNLEKATTLFGEQEEEKLQVWKGDTRNPENLDPSIFEDVTHVICCSGTTAFPSRRWDGDNTPERVDWEGVKNLVSVLPPTLERIVLVSSVGVTKSNELPWSIMNLFGVLKYKKMGEDFIRNSGLPYIIIRPGRLTDGPYTSYDLNTLLKATTGERRAVLIGQGDKLVGEVSRLVVAEACLQVLDLEFSQGQIYEINSVQGDGPGCDQQKWKELFEAAQLQ